MAAKKVEPKKPGTSVTPPKQQQDKGPLVVMGDQAQMPDYLRENQQGQARGSENVATEDLVIPRLEVLQDLSPQVDKSEPKYIKGAEPGLLMNSVTNRIYGNRVAVVPVYFQKSFLLWRDRDAGGGFLGAFPDPAAAEERKKQEKDSQNLQIIDTPIHYCLLVDADHGTVEEIVIAMPRTKAKVSRQWNSMVRLAGGDRFSRVYLIGTAKEKNKKGQFYNYTITQSGFPMKRLFEAAEKMYASFTAAGGQRRTMDTTGFEPGSPGSEDDESKDM